MKRRDLVKRLESSGWYLLRHGSDHDIYKNDRPTGKRNLLQVPRHTDVKDETAKSILRDAGL